MSPTPTDYYPIDNFFSLNEKLVADAVERTKAAEIPLRVGVLEEAVRLTKGDRDQTYGPPSINMACFSELVRIYQAYAGVNCNAHDAAMFNVLSKISRIACNPDALKRHRDNYVDGAAYFAIAWEVSQ